MRLYTHTHTGIFRKQKNKNEKNKKPIIIEFNLSKSVAVIILIVVIVMAITTKKVVETIIEAKEQKALANETTTTTSDENVTWVKSTATDENGNEVVETDLNGNEITVPVPKGYTASKIEGETTASKGFVIYEGDVDWSTILVDDDTESTSDTTDKAITEVTNTTTTEFTEEVVDTTENDTTAIENTTGETSTETTVAVTQEEINIFNLQKTVNQYVWVPVENVNEIYGIDANGKLWGKLYNFTNTGTTSLNWTETNGVMSITDKTSYREPDVISYTSGYDVDSMLPNYGVSNETRNELLTQEMEQGFYNMIESIKKYGGFYIGRYETGGLNGTAVIRKMDTNLAFQTWYTMYKKCKNLNGTNDNVETSMIWGSLWDETLKWLESSGATTSDGTDITYALLKNSKTWGNHSDSTFTYIAENATEPIETETKAMSTNTRIPTGSSNYTKVNNIYDMAGNEWEWTLETCNGGAKTRVGRGGAHYYNGFSAAQNRHFHVRPDFAGANYYSCRSILLIK